MVKRHLGFILAAGLSMLYSLSSCSFGTVGEDSIREEVSKHFEDPQGDSVGFIYQSLYYLYDIIFIDVAFNREDRYLTVRVTFDNQVYPPLLKWGDKRLVGLFEIDADQNPDTGTTLTTIQYTQYTGIDFWANDKGYPLSNMGVDFSINLFKYDPLFKTVEIYEHIKDERNPENIIIRQTGYAVVDYGEQTCSLRIPLAALGDDEGSIDFGCILGNFNEPTDMAYTYSFNVE
jgi:hypothetical protein